MAAHSHSNQTVSRIAQDPQNNRLLLNDSLRECITARLAQFNRNANRNSRLRQAAVALTIIDREQDDSASFLLTRRPTHLHRHGGQYALPGGKRDQDESAQETALRELREEMGIGLTEKHVLGMLDDYQTRSGFNITPVVVWAGSNRNLDPDPNEIARVFRIPLDDLKSPDIPCLETTTAGEHPVLSTPLATLGHRVFAPTAAFIYQFREIVIFNRHTRVAHLDQPKFAWK